ncbi:phosphoglucomutase [Clostridioides difficile]|uniref:Phosphohexomutase n=3 Tax=Clostridioides difficile TaxID=1496 RepID=A0AAX3GYK9_CLODI|nr:phosphoglucomutase [Clostridioides difficile]AVD34464.1 phosphomannomutase/phosphoglucomutase [Clostridioides difficile]AVD38677.1 phosphomannomutase/phosphoglucomutase [Clostridioides difficile]AVD42208.1 phosphomannomutase/phosphoglucomutase [Clostridioides difficile]AXU68764.1 phosphoglucomutase [Clostridioides difficile]AXU90896.1 phosphoglucomutase [Clostridioides difficile]
MGDLYKLQNGTDIRGIAYENDSKEVNLTVEEVRKIAKAFHIWLKEKTKKDKVTVAIGTDSRITGSQFRSAVIETLTNDDCNVIDCEIATTPAMFMTTIMDGYNSDGSIMITASHLPYYYNGLKFFTESGGLEKADIKEMLDIADKNDSVDYEKANKKGKVISKNLIEDYSNLLIDKIRKGVNSSKNYEKPFSGLKILVDAGNGAGGFFAEKVLHILGADTTGSQFLNPDGMFPNHIPNPENKEAMESICKAVLDNKSDLGIIFDTDVDRAAIVGKNGKPINKNALIAVISSIVLEEHPKTAIVTDSITSEGLAKFINELQGRHHRYKRGYKNVINEAIRLNSEGEECHLAIETSGHAALKENYFLDDGAYLIAKILIKVAKLSLEGKTIEELIENLEEAREEKEVRIGINKEDFRPYAEDILKDLDSHVRSIDGWSVAPNNFEGIRVNCDESNGDGWFLLRISLHEPLLALNIESNKIGGAEQIYSKLKLFLEKYDLRGL